MHMHTQPPVPSSIYLIPDQSIASFCRHWQIIPEQRQSSAAALASAFCRAIIQSPTPGCHSRYTHYTHYTHYTRYTRYTHYTHYSRRHSFCRHLPLVRQTLLGAETEAAQKSPVQPVSAISPVSPVGLSESRPPRHSKNRRALTIAIVAFAVISLIIISVFSVVLINNNAHISSDATATARSETVAATAAASATARAQVIATAGPLATATGGTPNYADSLNDSNNPATQMAQWDGLVGTNSQCIFKPDGYHVVQSTGIFNLHACQETSYNYGDATISGSVNILHGDSGGLFLRFNQANGGSGYLFEINSMGKYKFSLFQGNVLQDWTPSSALKVGYNMTNTLAVIMKGNTFALYANGAYITTLADPSNTYASGVVALFASAPSNNTEVIFSNFKVYSPS